MVCTSIQGTDSAFSTYADIHLWLNLPGASNNELIYSSGHSPREMMTMNEFKKYITFGVPPLKFPEEIDKQFESERKREDSRSGNIYDVIGRHPKLTKFKKLIDYTGYNKVKSEDVTVFAPLDDLYDDILFYDLDIAYKPVSALQTLRYHILPYKIQPWQMSQRKLRMRTDLENQPVESDWTRNQHYLINPISLRKSPNNIIGLEGIGDSYPAWPDNWFEKNSWLVKVEAFIECSNGYLYIIERPLVFPKVV